MQKRIPYTLPQPRGETYHLQPLPSPDFRFQHRLSGREALSPVLQKGAPHYLSGDDVGLDCTFPRILSGTARTRLDVMWLGDAAVIPDGEHPANAFGTATAGLCSHLLNGKLSVPGVLDMPLYHRCSSKTTRPGHGINLCQSLSIL